MKSDYTTNSRYITHTIAFWKVGRIHFLSSGVKGLTLKMKTSYESGLECLILSSNRWLKIARQKTAFPRWPWLGPGTCAHGITLMTSSLHSKLPYLASFGGLFFGCGFLRCEQQFVFGRLFELLSFLQQLSLLLFFQFPLRSLRGATW